MPVDSPSEQFDLPPHDPRAPHSFLADELRQRRESGYPVNALEARLAEADPAGTDGALDAIWDELADLRRGPDWTYDEPEGLAAVADSLTPTRRVDTALGEIDDYDDRVLGGWLGRIAGCNVGKPVEQGWHWTRAHIRDYLIQAGAYPLRDYVPVLDPMPPGFELRENWPETTLGNVNGSARDDDIDYAILALDLLEAHHFDVSPDAVAAAWLRLLPFDQTFTAERATYANLVAGVAPTAAAVHRNPYREWIGALIRADVYGYVLPGRPRRAALLAAQDASLSHVANGLYGAMWAAALVSSAFTHSNPRDVVVESLRHVPPRSRLHEAVSAVVGDHAAGLSWEHTLDRADARWGALEWVHTVNNAAVITAGILHGRGELSATVGLTVQGGLDTDSNAATAGSVAGILSGASVLPTHLIHPLHDTTRSALFGFDRTSISDLAARTVQVATDLDAASDTHTVGGTS